VITAGLPVGYQKKYKVQRSKHCCIWYWLAGFKSGNIEVLLVLPVPGFTFCYPLRRSFQSSVTGGFSFGFFKPADIFFFLRRTEFFELFFNQGILIKDFN